MEGTGLSLKGCRHKGGGIKQALSLIGVFPLYFFFLLFWECFGACSFPGLCDIQPKGFRAEGCLSSLVCIKRKMIFSLKGCFLINLQAYMKEEWVDPILTGRLCNVGGPVFIKSTETVRAHI